MFRRPVYFFTCALVAAAAWLALRNAPTTAQTPPATNDIEKRMQALEQKLDRLLVKIDPQPKAALDADAFRKQLDLMTQARETLVRKLEQDSEKYAEFRKQNPYPILRAAGSNLYQERFKQIEVDLSAVRRKLTEVTAAMATVERALKSPEDQAPVLLLLKRRGIDLSKLPGVPENDVAAQLRVYLRSLKLEADEQSELVRAAANESTTVQTHARGIAAYEIEEDRHKARLASTRQLLEAIIKRMNEINLVKDTIR